MTANRHNALTRGVLKAMSLFTGMQAIGIVCSLVKMKLVALWLQATGVGLFGIYQSVADTVMTLTERGLRQSAVRDVAKASGDPSLLSRVAYALRRWSLFMGLAGGIIIVGAAPVLGKVFFHSYGAVWGFLMLAVALVFNALAGGEQALLQGTDRLKALARASVVGSVAGLAVSIPLFRWLGLTSVPLSILVYALTGWAEFYRLRVRTPRPRAMGLGHVWREGKGFARLGLLIAIAQFITSLAHTVFIALLNAWWGVEEVGYVQAGDTVLVRYLGMVFMAISLEFYPRLSRVEGRPRMMRLYVLHEITLLMLLLTPLLLLFILCRELVVRILFTSDFLVILPMLTWGCISCLPKAWSWCMAYALLARGEGRLYLALETLDALISVPLCLYAYSRWGMAGLGVAYVVWYLLICLPFCGVYVRRLHLSLSPRLLWLTAGSIVLLAGAGLAMDCLPLWVCCILLPAAALIYIPPLRRMMKK